MSDNNLYRTQLWYYNAEDRKWEYIDTVYFSRIPPIGELYRHHQEHELGNCDYEVVNIITDQKNLIHSMIVFPVTYDEAGLPPRLSDDTLTNLEESL